MYLGKTEDEPLISNFSRAARKLKIISPCFVYAALAERRKFGPIPIKSLSVTNKTELMSGDPKSENFTSTTELEECTAKAIPEQS